MGAQQSDLNPAAAMEQSSLGSREREGGSSGKKWRREQKGRLRRRRWCRTDHRISRSAISSSQLGSAEWPDRKRETEGERERRARKGVLQKCHCNSFAFRPSNESTADMKTERDWANEAQAITPRRRDGGGAGAALSFGRRHRKRGPGRCRAQLPSPPRRGRQFEVLPLIAFLWERKLHVSSRCYTAPFMLE